MNKRVLSGWILSGLLGVLFLVISAGGKLFPSEGAAEELARTGWTAEQMKVIAGVEIAITLLYLIPPTSFLGAVLLTGYLGGAVAAHARVDESVIAPIVIGILVWIALGLRQSGIFTMAFGAILPQRDVKTKTG